MTVRVAWFECGLHVREGKATNTDHSMILFCPTAISYRLCKACVYHVHLHVSLSNGSDTSGGTWLECVRHPVAVVGAWQVIVAVTLFSHLYQAVIRIARYIQHGTAKRESAVEVRE